MIHVKVCVLFGQAFWLSAGKPAAVGAEGERTDPAAYRKVAELFAATRWKGGRYFCCLASQCRLLLTFGMPRGGVGAVIDLSVGIVLGAGPYGSS